MAKESKQQSLPEAEDKPLAVTYYAAKAAKEWEVWRVLVYREKVKREVVQQHSSRLVVRERLRVLLASKEVLP